MIALVFPDVRFPLARVWKWHLRFTAWFFILALAEPFSRNHINRRGVCPLPIPKCLWRPRRAHFFSIPLSPKPEFAPQMFANIGDVSWPCCGKNGAKNDFFDVLWSVDPIFSRARMTKPSFSNFIWSQSNFGAIFFHFIRQQWNFGPRIGKSIKRWN